MRISQAVRDDVGPRPERDPGDGGGFHVAGRAAALARARPGFGVFVFSSDETGVQVVPYFYLTEIACGFSTSDRVPLRRERRDDARRVPRAR